MARIEGVDLPRNKRIDIALTSIFGIGRHMAKGILAQAGVDGARRTVELTEMEIANIRNVIQQQCTVEGDLRRDNAVNLKRLVDLGCYRGLSHRKGLPVRGQRTHTNARTRKGKARPVAGKKKA